MYKFEDSKIVIDCGDIKKQSEFHEMIVERLDFPDHYGGNLDALYDVMCELPPVTLVLKRVKKFKKHLGGRADLILAVLGEAAEYNDGLVIDIEE